MRIGDQHRSFRLVVGYHGTSREVADRLLAPSSLNPAQSHVERPAFRASTNVGDWLGHGIYFWEQAPSQAWWWADTQAQKGKHTQGAVIGALIDLGHCVDLLDPAAGWAGELESGRLRVEATLGAAALPVPRNANNHKALDCAVVNDVCLRQSDHGTPVDSLRALFAPSGGGLQRLWERSGLLRFTHVQLCVRNPDCFLAVWDVPRP